MTAVIDPTSDKILLGAIFRCVQDQLVPGQAVAFVKDNGVYIGIYVSNMGALGHEAFVVNAYGSKTSRTFSIYEVQVIGRTTLISLKIPRPVKV